MSINARWSWALVAALGVALAGPSPPARAQWPAAAPVALADPRPRDVGVPGAALLASQPQVNGGVGNKLDFSAALAIEPGGATVETFGVVFAPARTQVDKVERNVVFENLQISRTDVPTLPLRDADCTAALQKSQPQHLRSISPGRLQASLAAAGVQHIGVQVPNEAPQVIVSCSPGILVPVDGAPVWKPVPGGQCTERMK